MTDFFFFMSNLINKEWGLIKTQWSYNVSQSVLLTQTEQSLFVRLRSSGCEWGILLQDSECLLLPARSLRCWKLPKAHSSLRQTQGITVEQGKRNSKFCSWAKTHLWVKLKNIPADADCICQTPVNKRQIKGKRNSLLLPSKGSLILS